MAPPVVEHAMVKPRFDIGDCRFYERKYPEKEELTMVKVSRIADMGAYVSLLEYNGLEGMILMSELSKRRIRSVKKIVRVNRHEVVLVLRVDKEKGYIDLSKKRVSPEDVAKCEERFSKSKRVHQIICHIAQKHQISVEELNKMIAWPLQKRFGHALDAFKDPTFLTTIINELQCPEEVKETLAEDVRLRLASHAMRLRIRIDVWCFGPEGVDAVRDALKKGKAVAEADDPEAEVRVKLIAPPQYVMITNCGDKEEGTKRLESALKTIESTIKSYKGGDFKIQGEIIVIGGEDDKKLDDDLLEEDEEDGSGDSDDSEEEDEGMGLVDEKDLPPDVVAADEEE